jgi:hypothetical protein
VFDRIGEAPCVRLGAGALAIGHRPPLRALEPMRRAGFTHIATVLAENENPHAIGAAAEAAELGWLWLELGSTKSLPARGKAEIATALATMADILRDGGCLYLHCSAGIHRTGMIAAALMFHLSCSEDDIRAALTALRPITAQDVGEARFEWARSFAPR